MDGPTCDCCGGPRINGADIRRLDGEWQLVHDRHYKNRRACRSCVRALVHGIEEDLDRLDRRAGVL